MNNDLQKASELMVAQLQRELGDEIDLVFRFGSSLQGQAHAYSDLDICYVPAHDTTWDNITVLVDDILVDLFAYNWPRLEQAANFDSVNCTLLANNEIVYSRSDETAARFQALQERLRANQQPQARPAMLQKAQKLFQSAGYQYYLLRQQAGAGHQLAAMQHAQNILKIVLHSLAVANQACIDTRKLDQVLALERLPEGMADLVDGIMRTTDPQELLAASEALLDNTRALLLAEQAQAHRTGATFVDVLSGAYPELKNDLQHLMLACERQDTFNFNLLSFLHELMIHMAWAVSGIGYSDFNSIADYEQDLAGLGFPKLLPYVEAGDFAGLHEQCLAFDRRLQEYLQEQDVALNAFANVEELQEYLNSR